MEALARHAGVPLASELLSVSWSGTTRQVQCAVVRLPNGLAVVHADLMPERITVTVPVDFVSLADAQRRDLLCRCDSTAPLCVPSYNCRYTDSTMNWEFCMCWWITTYSLLLQGTHLLYAPVWPGPVDVTSEVLDELNAITSCQLHHVVKFVGCLAAMYESTLKTRGAPRGPALERVRAAATTAEPAVYQLLQLDADSMLRQSAAEPDAC